MGGEHDIFVFQGGVAAWELGDEVDRLYFGDVDFRFRCERNGERKVRQRLAIFTKSRDFFKSVAGAGKKFLGARRIDGDIKLCGVGLVELGIVEIHAGMGAIERDAGPWDVHRGGVDQRNNSDGAGGAQQSPALGRGLVMRSERTRNLGGRSGKDHDDFAADVDAGEVVIILLGNLEAIADEDQRRFDLGRGHNAGADDGIFAEYQRFAFAVADEGKAAFLFDDLAGDELDGLVEAVYARGVRAGAFELL